MDDVDNFRWQSTTDALQATETVETGANTSSRLGGEITTDAFLGEATANEHQQCGDNREESSDDENRQTDLHLFKCLEESLYLCSTRPANMTLQVCVSAMCVSADRCQRRYSSMLDLLKEVGSVQDPSRLKAVLPVLCWEEDIHELSELISIALDCKDREEFFRYLFLNRQYCWLFMWCLGQRTWDELGDDECLDPFEDFCERYEHFEVTRLRNQNREDDLYARACIYFKSERPGVSQIDNWISEESKKMLNSFPSEVSPMLSPVVVDLKIMLAVSRARTCSDHSLNSRNRP